MNAQRRRAQLEILSSAKGPGEVNDREGCFIPPADICTRRELRVRMMRCLIEENLRKASATDCSFKSQCARVWNGMSISARRANMGCLL
jgi:hypothetical protein